MWRIAGLMVAGILLAGCSAPRTVDVDDISVEGRVSMRGAEPFADLVLQTDDNNLYALDVTQAQRATFSTPIRLQVRGRLYLGEFAGRPFARIEVGELTVPE